MCVSLSSYSAEPQATGAGGNRVKLLAKDVHRETSVCRKSGIILWCVK